MSNVEEDQMPVQTTQAALAAISIRLRDMEETLRQILDRVPPAPSQHSSRPATPPPK